CSVALYLGQLTDPLRHTLFVLGYIYIMEDRPFALAAALALGVLAKETAVLLGPGWFVCHAWKARRTRLVTALLGARATAAGVGAGGGWAGGRRWAGGRGPRGRRGRGVMIPRTLGWGPRAPPTSVPLVLFFVHPLLFTVPFLPWVVRNWRAADVRLRWLLVTM